MPFDSPDYDLDELLKDVASGDIQLPDFQRPWKWDDDRIRSLIESISYEHPIGVVMMLEIGGDGVRFKPTLLAGVVSPSVANPEHLLLDGQQRLTSLFQALASREAVDTVDARGKKLRRFYYLDIEQSLDGNADRYEAILSVPEDRVLREDFGRRVTANYSTLERECEAGVFPLNRAFEPAALFEWMGKYVSLYPEKAGERTDTWNRFYSEVLSNIVKYKVPVIVLNRETPKEAVCTVFEKVNTGGVALNVFELLTATFAADDFRLNEDWTRRKSRLNHWPALRQLQSTDFLQAISLLATRERRLQAVTEGAENPPGISAKRKDILRLTLDEYLRWADAVTDALVWCATFFAQERIFRSEDVPYRTQLVPLSAIRVVLGQDADQHAAATKLRQWYWCGVLGELYGGTTETRFARDLDQMVSWVSENGRIPITVSDAGFREARLFTLRTRISAAYKGIHALLMRSDCLDWVYRQPMGLASFFDYQVDIHHIFPKAWCDREGIDQDHRESIINKTPLSYATNRSIGGRSPAQYVPLVREKAGIDDTELDRLIGSHAIDPSRLRSADFTGFFAARKEALLALIEEAMGKAPIREEAPDEVVALEYEEEMVEEPETEAVVEILDTGGSELGWPPT